MTTEIECPTCGDYLTIQATDSDQGDVYCRECHTLWTVHYDAQWEPDASLEGRWWGGHYLKESRDQPCRHNPAAWRSCPQCTDAHGGV